MPDDRPEDIHTKEQTFRRHEQLEEFRRKKQLADTWCAAFMIEKQLRESGREASATGITQRHLNDLAAGQPLPANLAAEVERLTKQHQFFHWTLAFPEVFAKGGFDCVLGNPPWERINIKEKEWFARRRPDIANAANAGVRKRLIESLRSDDPALYAEFQNALRFAESESHFIRHSGTYPLCGRGDVNLYAVFAESMRARLAPTGRSGSVSAFNQIGRIPRHAALDMGRKLKREHPAADSLLLPSPHWPTAGVIEQLERELGINVMTAQQAIVWDALRRCGVNDPIPGFGRLLREF